MSRIWRGRERRELSRAFTESVPTSKARNRRRVARHYSVSALSADKAAIIAARAARFSRLKEPIDNLIYFERLSPRHKNLPRWWFAPDHPCAMNYDARELRIRARPIIHFVNELPRSYARVVKCKRSRRGSRIKLESFDAHARRRISSSPLILLSMELIITCAHMCIECAHIVFPFVHDMRTVVVMNVSGLMDARAAG